MARRFPFTSLAMVAGLVYLDPAAHAQTCASPIPIYQHETDSGTSCGANNLPALNHGTISTPGDDVVYHVVPGENGATNAALTVDLEGSGFPDSLFLCRAPCGPNSECVDAGSVFPTGSATVRFSNWEPGNGGDYYLIVDNTGGECGNYSLNLNGPLGKKAH